MPAKKKPVPNLAESNVIFESSSKSKAVLQSAARIAQTKNTREGE